MTDMNQIDGYLAHDWKLCVIPPYSKRPTTPGWNLPDHALRSTEDLPEGHGVGLLHAYSGTAALDVDHLPTAREKLAKHGIDLDALLSAPDAVQITSGRPGHTKLLYSVPGFLGPLATRKVCALIEGKSAVSFELRQTTADGRSMQDVLPPSMHPDTRQPYQWAGSGDWRRLPLIPPPLFTLWRTMLDADKHQSIPSDEVRAASWDEIREALAFISPDCSRDEWIAVGMALHLVGAQTDEINGALNLWDQWSQTSPSKYPGFDSIRRQWKSFRADKAASVTVKTLFHHAQQGGWVRPQIDASGLFEGVEGEARCSIEWPKPQPLTARLEPAPYPIDALPGIVGAAVAEVAGFVQAPVPLVASSALAALSLACQAQIDVRRAEKLSAPVGLYLLTIADSGERKSTCDDFFSSAIRRFQEKRAEDMKPALKDYEAAVAAWVATRDGLLLAVKSDARKGKATDRLRADLADLQHVKPRPPRVPRLLLGDETPESLAWSLAKLWPSAGVLSSEAGVVLGSHGMGKDSVMRNLALLNVLWSGEAHSVGRRTSESFTVRGARLTMGLMVQAQTLREFCAKAGPLARGSGFLARFLVAWPESTQGTRFFREAPANWPHLEAFHRRVTAILNQPAPIDDEGALSPAMLTLAPEAKAAWVNYHDAIEKELTSGGELYDVRDVASKTADNAARLAALFQLFEHGMGGAVGRDCIERAGRIAAWHLSESRRFFGELALPAEVADAVRLDSWLIEYCRRERTSLVPTREAQRLGPVRDRAKLETALRVLEEHDRVKLEQDGRRKTIEVNPALVAEVTP